MSSELEQIHRDIANCYLCPRLVAWREASAANPPKRFVGEKYWARGVPGFGDEKARLLIVGLAPAANGANRTGRMFTGDRSGDWLFRGMHKAGFCNQPFAVDANDGLQLTDAYIAATCRCAPPQNKPTREEMIRCRPFLEREMRALKDVKVLLGLGKIGFDAAFRTARDLGFVAEDRMRPIPKFGHGVCYQLNEKLWLLGTFHPSQQNTFTGKLTEEMFDAVFARAREIINEEPRT